MREIHLLRFKFTRDFTEFALSDVRPLMRTYDAHPHPKIALDTNGVERALPIRSADHRVPYPSGPHR
jgi:hypothetical protein